MSRETSNGDNIIKVYSLKCDVCQKNIEVPINKSDKEKQIGGIFRIVAIHQCLEEPVAHILFFDDFLTLRQKVKTTITLTNMNDYDYFDDCQKEYIKQVSGLKYLKKKFGVKINQIVYSILIGQQIVFLGTKNAVEASINSILIFGQKRHITVNSWTSEKHFDADIIGTIPEYIDEFDYSLLVNLETNEIINGTNNSYSAFIIEKALTEPNFQTFENFLSNQLSLIDNIIDEIIMVESVVELEQYLTSYVLEGLSEDLIDIVVPIGAQLNAVIAVYYRNNFETLFDQDLSDVKPSRIWILEENLKKTEPRQITFDVLYNYKEEKIINKLVRFLKLNNSNINLVEYFTPLNQYVLLPEKDINIIYCFPRFNYDNKIITNAFNFHLKMLDKKQLSNLPGKKISQYITKLWGQKTAKNIPKEYQNLLEIRDRLPLVFMHSILESYYINTNLPEIYLKDVMSDLIESISEILTTEVKIKHKGNLYSICSIIKDQFLDASNENPIDINLDLHIYSQKNAKSNLLSLIVDIYITPEFTYLGIETYEIFYEIYSIISKILQKIIRNYR